MIPIIGTVKAWTVIWNLLLISFTGGLWLLVLIVWWLCKQLFGKKSWHFSPKRGGFAIFAGPLLFQKWRKLTKKLRNFLPTFYFEKLSMDRNFWPKTVQSSKKCEILVKNGQFCGQMASFAHFSKTKSGQKKWRIYVNFLPKMAKMDRNPLFFFYLIYRKIKYI